MFVFSFCINEKLLTHWLLRPCGFKTEGGVTHGCLGQRGTLNEVLQEAWGPGQGIYEIMQLTSRGLRGPERLVFR